MRRQDSLVGLFNSRNRPRASCAEDIYHALLDAIVVQDLPPGTKLGEEMLVEVFNLGRRPVAAALDRLSWGGVVTRRANRGAWVATPDAAEAHEVFAARQTIERGVVEALLAAGSRPDYRTVEAEMAQERVERARGNLRAAIKLSGRFHILLADLSENRILAGQVALLVARTSLVVALFERPDAMSCWQHDHGALLRLIQAGDRAGAVEAMERHLEELFRGLDFSRAVDDAFDLRRVFRKGL